MTLQEPTTFISNMILAGASLVFGHWAYWKYSKKFDSRYYQIWALTFLFTGIGSILGGFHHGFDLKPLWPWTLLFIGLASCFLLLGVFYEYFYQWKKILFPIAFLKYALFVIIMFTYTMNYNLVIFDYTPPFLFLLLMNIWQYKKTRSPAACKVSLGILICIVGSVTQMMKLGFGQYFNFNDVYHILETIGLYLIYRGVAKKQLRIENALS